MVISGTRLPARAAVLVGGGPATVTGDFAPSSIVVRTAPHVAGRVDVTVYSPTLRSETVGQAYTYVEPAGSQRPGDVTGPTSPGSPGGTPPVGSTPPAGGSAPVPPAPGNTGGTPETPGSGGGDQGGTPAPAGGDGLIAGPGGLRLAVPSPNSPLSRLVPSMWQSSDCARSSCAGVVL